MTPGTMALFSRYCNCIIIQNMLRLQIVFRIMALPHMPSLYTTRKNIYEQAIVRRRTHENDMRDSWQGTARYFNTAEIHSSKDATWTSKATFDSRCVVFYWFAYLYCTSGFIFLLYRSYLNQTFLGIY